MPLKKQKKHRRNKRLIILIVLALVVVGGVVWYFVIRKPEPAKQAQSSQTSEQQQVESATEVVTTTEHYVSQAFNLSLDYPSNWKVDDSDAATLKVISPKVSLTDYQGKKTDAKITVKIRGKGSQLPEVTGQPTATRDSEKISYTQPSSQQRGQTYLSFVGHDTGLDGVYVTGDKGYVKDGTIPKSDLALGDPIISITFETCQDSGCDASTTNKLSIEDAEWDTNPFLKQAKTLIQSLVIS